jgi:hypothetical protein
LLYTVSPSFGIDDLIELSVGDKDEFYRGLPERQRLDHRRNSGCVGLGESRLSGEASQKNQETTDFTDQTDSTDRSSVGSVNFPRFCGHGVNWL